jgi:hypothetical protein
LVRSAVVLGRGLCSYGLRASVGHAGVGGEDSGPRPGLRARISGTHAASPVLTETP